MGKLSVAVLLLAALVLPIAVFLLLWPGLHWSALLAAALAITAGWALNIAWAFAASKASSDDANTVSIAAFFGWLCPAVLVLLTWLAWRWAA